MKVEKSRQHLTNGSKATGAAALVSLPNAPRGFSFRRGTHQDIRAVQGVYAAALAAFPSGPEVLAYAVKHGRVAIEIREALKSGDFVVAERGGVIVGFVVLKSTELAGEPRPFAEVTMLYLSAACRGKGLGNAMLGHVLAEARAWGFDKALLVTLHEFTAAVRLYKAHGFRTVPDRKYPADPRQLEMELDLAANRRRAPVT